MADGNTPFTVIAGGKLSPCERVIRAYRIVVDADRELALEGETSGIDFLARALVVTMTLRFGPARTLKTIAAALSEAAGSHPASPGAA